MPKGYWIAHVEVRDLDHYRQFYVQANGPVFAKFGARFLVRAGSFEVAEGSNARSRHVVIEFPSYQAAQDCYHSPEYQALVKVRSAVSTADVLILEGYEGPQPG